MMSVRPSALTGGEPCKCLQWFACHKRSLHCACSTSARDRLRAAAWVGRAERLCRCCDPGVMHTHRTFGECHSSCPCAIQLLPTCTVRQFAQHRDIAFASCTRACLATVQRLRSPAQGSAQNQAGSLLPIQAWRSAPRGPVPEHSPDHGLDRPLPLPQPVVLLGAGHGGARLGSPRHVPQAHARVLAAREAQRRARVRPEHGPHHLPPRPRAVSA